MGRIRTEKKKLHITKKEILDLLKAGALITVALTAPNALILFKDSFKEEGWADYYPSSIKREITYLWRKGFVEISEENGQQLVKLTNNGKAEILLFDIGHMALSKPEKWNGEWWIIIFDIPEDEKNKREFLRMKLKEMEFYSFQESVWITPYSCQKEIEYLREVLEIPHFVKIMKANFIENDEDLRRIFNLA